MFFAKGDRQRPVLQEPACQQPLEPFIHFWRPIISEIFFQPALQCSIVNVVIGFGARDLLRRLRTSLIGLQPGKDVLGKHHGELFALKVADAPVKASLGITETEDTRQNFASIDGFPALVRLEDLFRAVPEIVANPSRKRPALFYTRFDRCPCQNRIASAAPSTLNSLKEQFYI